MTDEEYLYTVKCSTCRTPFKVQLFDSRERALFLVDKKDWYCEKCKKEYFRKETSKLTEAHRELGFSELEGSSKMISWAEKIRAELINKVNYLQNSLSFESDLDKKVSDEAFQAFFQEWQANTEAKWWIDRRKMNVRDISTEIGRLSETLKKE